MNIIILKIMIAIGIVGLPLWMLIFTVLPIFIVLAPFRILETMKKSL